jgi:uncharacterized coiled-coil DUF342 family protein
MTLDTINTYRNRQEQILEEIDQMNQNSNWTEEMGKQIEKLDNKFSFLKMRIDEIEEMISFNDDYYYAYLNTQY